MQGAHPFAPVFACGCCVCGAHGLTSVQQPSADGGRFRSFRVVAMHVFLCFSMDWEILVANPSLVEDGDIVSVCPSPNTLPPLPQPFPPPPHFQPPPPPL